MFCPQCRYEYVGGIAACPRCNVALVTTLPPAPEPRRQPQLRRATLGALLGISYFFVLRTVGTIFPDFFFHLPIARSAQILSIFAAGTLAWFFFALYHEYVRPRHPELKILSILTLGTVSASVCLRIYGLIYALYVPPSPVNARPLFHPQWIGEIVVWCSSICILLFFVALYKKICRSRNPLAPAVRFAAIGSGIATAMQTVILTELLFSGLLNPIGSLSGVLALFLMPIMLCSYLAVLYFYYTFYRQQSVRVAPSTPVS